MGAILHDGADNSFTRLQSLPGNGSSSVSIVVKVREDIKATMAAGKNIWDFNLESKPKPKKYNFELCRLNSSKVKFKSCDIGQHSLVCFA